MPRQPFSKRHNYRGPAPEITIREDAPESLRATVLAVARELDWSSHALRGVLTRTLRVRPDPGNWSAGNVSMEVESLAYDCEWFRFYDFIERLYESMMAKDLEEGRHGTSEAKAPQFVAEVNEALIEDGIGWQLVDGDIVTRGTESFEASVRNARAALDESSRPTAASHIHDALQALSRRPEADLSGAVYHAMGALEDVARDLVGDAKLTLGEILKRHPTLLPAPLDKALSQIWGFASNEARHVVEGRAPTLEEAELVVGLAAAAATYLTKKGR